MSPPTLSTVTLNLPAGTLNAPDVILAVPDVILNLLSDVILNEVKDLAPSPEEAPTAVPHSSRKVLRFAQDDMEEALKTTGRERSGRHGKGAQDDGPNGTLNVPDVILNPLSNVILNEVKDLAPAPEDAQTAIPRSPRKVLRFAQDDMEEALRATGRERSGRHGGGAQDDREEALRTTGRRRSGRRPEWHPERPRCHPQPSLQCHPERSEGSCALA